MQRLSDSLKQMLAGLAFQDAGDYLSLREKTKTLGIEAKVPVNPSSHTTSTSPSARRHIALISDGQNAEATLNYAIDTSKRQQATIDLLIRGGSDKTAINALEEKLRKNGITYRSIPLTGHEVNSVMSHIEQQTNLLYLIATSGDLLAQRLLETMSTKPGKRMPVPIVLIEARPVQETQALKQTAA